MYNDNLKATIEANTLAISAMQSQLTTVAAEVEKTNEDIQARFNKHFIDSNKICPAIPARMLPSFKAYLSESLIRIGWTDYSRPDRTNTLDIYYYNDKHYDQRDTSNHRWEITSSSNRLIVNTTEAGWSKQDGEDIDRMKLSLGLFDLINLTSKHILAFHKEYIDNQTKAYTIQSAIHSLQKGITDAEKTIKRNTYLRMFKPGGETAVCKFNTDIKAATVGSYYISRRNGIAFDAVNLIKETAKGIRVEFVRYSEATETREAQRWVQGTKWVSLNTLISLFESIEDSHIAKLKRDAEREAERSKRELENQTK